MKALKEYQKVGGMRGGRPRIPFLPSWAEKVGEKERKERGEKKKVGKSGQNFAILEEL